MDLAKELELNLTHSLTHMHTRTHVKVRDSGSYYAERISTVVRHVLAL